MKTFINYYGAKFRNGNMYPNPSCDVIVEPFAGGAGYSLRHWQKKVFLYEKNQLLVEMWKWLIAASEEDVMSLPIDFDHLDAIDAPTGAKTLIGFCLNTGTVTPCKTRSKWANQYTESEQFWGQKRRKRIASQVNLIKHWECYFVSDYTDIPNTFATWFIDPPYQKQGTYYTHGSQDIDFAHLSNWCHMRSGELIVCEQDGADWMEWTNRKNVKSNAKTKVSSEVWMHRGLSR